MAALGMMGTSSAPANSVATTDPGVLNDSTQGYVPGAIWLNTSNSRCWMCQSNAVGAAVWYLMGTVPGTGTMPGTMLMNLGGSTASCGPQGNINRQTVGTAVQPGTTGNDNVLAVYTLPASAFDVAGRGLTITAGGSFGATANTKRVKLIFNATTAVVGSAVTGGTAIADTAAVTTNGGGWQLMASVFKYGAAASNTQLGVHNQAQVGGAVAALLAPTLLTAIESGAIIIAITGNATTATTDINFNWLEINAMN